MKRFQLIAGALGILGTISGLDAPPVLAQTLDCAAFKPQPNGRWSPTREVTITGPGGTATIGPEMRIAPGAIFAGLPVAELLEKQCKGTPPKR
jgi:hypothetical protein